MGKGEWGFVTQIKMQVIPLCMIINISLSRTVGVSVFICLTASSQNPATHYNDVIMSVMASQITSLAIVYSTVHSRRRSKKHRSSASLAFVRGIHRWPVNSPHKGPVTRKMFPFDDFIMKACMANQLGDFYRSIDNSTTHAVMLYMTTTWHGNAFLMGCWPYDIFFVAILNKLLKKQSRCRWFETPWRPCDVAVLNF